MFAAVRREGFGSLAQGMIKQLLCQMAAALLLTWLLMQTGGLSYFKRVVFLGVGERDCRFTELELVGVFGSLHRTYACGLHVDLAACRLGHRQSREAANSLAGLSVILAKERQ